MDIDQIVNLLASGILNGAWLPLLIAVFQQPQLNNTHRALITVVVCAIAGMVQVYQIEGGLTLWPPYALLLTITTTTLAATAFYKNIWKPLCVAPWIETMTSPNGG